MISTIPLPRPVSVNSPILSLPSPVPFHKSIIRSTREAYQTDEDVVKSTHSLTVSLERHPGNDVEMGGLDNSPERSSTTAWAGIHFVDLPIEIHEAILDHLFGERTSGSGSNTPGRPDARSWIRALRHPRRKALSNLALITPVWRDLVQERIYRHSKYSMQGPQLATLSDLCI